MNWERWNKIIAEQQKRGFDKYVLGPFLIYCGMRYKNLPRQVRRLFVGAGIFQIFYSWQHYTQLQTKITQAVTNNEKLPERTV